MLLVLWFCFLLCGVLRIFHALLCIPAAAYPDLRWFEYYESDIKEVNNEPQHE